MSASRVPMRIPPTMATSVSSTLNTSPLIRNLETRSQVKNERSSEPMSVASADEPGHADPLLDHRHDPVDGHGGNDVKTGHREVHLHAARSFFLRLHGEHRELRNADCKGDGRILDDVHGL